MKKTKMKTKTKLPDKLSDLLDLAVDDCEKVAKLKTRVLQMNTYHLPLNNGQCAICMAGAIMDRTLHAPPRKALIPSDFDADTASKLSAVDGMRLGHLRFANRFDDDDLIDVFFKFRNMIEPHVNEHTGRAPWHVYRKAARMLRDAGL